MMKLIGSISLVISITLALLVFNLYQRNMVLDEEVAILREARERLLLEIGENVSGHVQAKTEIDRLTIELTSSNKRISELIGQIEEARLLVDPDIEQLRASIQREAEEEIFRQQIEIDNNRRQFSMTSELSRLSPERLSTLMRVNSLYGDYFNSLDVSDERMETLVNAFIEMTEMQNAALDEVRASNPRSKEEAEALMIPIFNSDLIKEVISVELTDEELNLFTEYQENYFIEGLPVRPEF